MIFSNHRGQASSSCPSLWRSTSTTLIPSSPDVSRAATPTPDLFSCTALERRVSKFRSPSPGTDLKTPYTSLPSHCEDLPKKPPQHLIHVVSHQSSEQSLREREDDNDTPRQPRPLKKQRSAISLSAVAGGLRKVASKGSLKSTKTSLPNKLKQRRSSESAPADRKIAASPPPVPSVDEWFKQKQQQQQQQEAIDLRPRSLRMSIPNPSCATLSTPDTDPNRQYIEDNLHGYGFVYGQGEGREEMVIHTWLPGPGTEEMKRRRHKAERERKKERVSKFGLGWVYSVFK